MNSDKGLRVKADRTSKKAGRGESATTSRSGRSATARAAGAAGTIEPKSTKRGHDLAGPKSVKRGHDLT